MNPPATSDSATRARVPWWRQRRRLFWIAASLAAIGLPWGGWEWWYRADFPMPLTAWLERMGVNAGWVEAWLGDHQWELMNWKVNRETRRLRLAGSTWENVQTKARLTFGRDGRLRVENAPDRSLFAGNHAWGGGVNDLTPEELTGLAAWHGSRFEFDRRAAIMEGFSKFLSDGTLVFGFESDDRNLDVSGSP